MAIQVSCPGCGKDYQLNDALRGKTVRCKNCDEAFQAGDETAAAEPAPASEARVRPSSPRAAVPARSMAPSSRRRDDDEDDEDSDDRPRSRRRRDDDDDDDDRPRRRKKSSGLSQGAIIGIVGGVVALVLVVTVAIIFAILPSKRSPVVPVAGAPPMMPNNMPPGAMNPPGMPNLPEAPPGMPNPPGMPGMAPPPGMPGAAAPPAQGPAAGLLKIELSNAKWEGGGFGGIDRTFTVDVRITQGAPNAGRYYWLVMERSFGGPFADAFKVSATELQRGLPLTKSIRGGFPGPYKIYLEEGTAPSPNIGKTERVSNTVTLN